MKQLELFGIMKKETYYISVVDIVRVLTDSTNPQTYWRVLKKTS